MDQETRLRLVIDVLTRERMALYEVASRHAVAESDLLKWRDAFILSGRKGGLGLPGTLELGTCTIDSAGTVTVNGNASTTSSNERLVGLHAQCVLGSSQPPMPSGQPQHAGFPFVIPGAGSGAQTVFVWAVFETVTTSILGPASQSVTP